jgi:hypothetical protein
MRLQAVLLELSLRQQFKPLGQLLRAQYHIIFSRNVSKREYRFISIKIIIINNLYIV